ncbi:hypothetical protein D9615_003538 [Tricholomella constricta]|uniref:DNA polymerase delta subunit 3 n=1 Tax=Tricholomella constricta TaxID=117010 RepID=A0A8H5M7C2_9AGAR|nr:hypothetical protein D9615_003538 [Tricholomella constricta]
MLMSIVFEFENTHGLRSSILTGHANERSSTFHSRQLRRLQHTLREGRAAGLTISKEQCKMGFLKRIFSLGGKKAKKQRPHIIHNVDARQRAIEEEEHEAAVGRLLRSSSTRYTIVSEVEYASLPPLPHPINNVVQTPAASTMSLASSTMSQRGTYNVTVHKRKQHTLTEVPSANRDDVTTPQRPLEPVQSIESSHLRELRSHPSVASLLDIYDEQGRIPAQAFSNSPPSPEKAERAQTRRNGSTLRQLLGEPPSLNSRNSNGAASTEGDISWAERFLGESDSVSSATSSVDLRTPRTPNAHFNNTSHYSDYPHDILVTDHDLSIITYEDPAISSMEVEFSIAESLPSVEGKSTDNNPYTNPDPTTPQRASQVFGFLTDRKQSRYVDDQERPLPEPPSAFSISSNEGSPSNSNEGRSHFSDDSFDVTSVLSARPAIPIPAFSHTFFDSQVDIELSQPDMTSVETSLDVSPSQATSHRTSEPTNTAETVWMAPNLRKAVNAPTRVIVTAPTPSGKHDTPSRIPRGPRAQSRRLSASTNKVRRATTLAERSSNSAVSHSIDTFTSVLPKHRSHRRNSSNGSSSTHSHNSHIIEIGLPTRLEKRGNSRRGSGSKSILNKENGAELTVNSKLPSTPLRSKSDSRALFRAAVTPSMFRAPVGMTPSPASSSDLSPVGKQMMIDVRQQRSKAREVERRKSGGSILGTSTRDTPALVTGRHVAIPFATQTAMSSQAAIDFLTKQIFIEKNIVTYRSLSRELRIHVNTAKNELAAYHENAPYHSQTSSATYLLCGKVMTPGDSDVDMDYNIGVDVGGDHEDDGDEVPQTKILLVNERDLEELVRTADRGEQAKEMVQLVGKIVGSNIQIIQPTTKGAKPIRQPVAGPSRQKATNDTTPNFKPKEKAGVVEPVKGQAKVTAAKPKEKPKATGKLNFAKAKFKETNQEDAVEPPKEKGKAEEKVFFTATSGAKGKRPKETLEPPKRGTKRKSTLDLSDSEDDTSSAAASKPPSKPPSESKEKVRVQKRTVLSDQEGDAPKPARKTRTSRSAKAVDSDTEDVQALMDIDDDQVDRVTRGASARIEDNDNDEEEEGEEKSSAVDEDVDMLDDPAPKPKPKKRREKKVIPVGRNGLKKKRVIKSRSAVDEKGYMALTNSNVVFEDYSEYESVDEEEEPEPAPTKGKANAKASAKAKREEEGVSPTPAAAKLKPSGKGTGQNASAKTTKADKSRAGAAKGAPKQKSLVNFFTSKPKN